MSAIADYPLPQQRETRRDVHFYAGEQVSVQGKRTATRKFDSCTENHSE